MKSAYCVALFTCVSLLHGCSVLCRSPEIEPKQAKDRVEEKIENDGNAEKGSVGNCNETVCTDISHGPGTDDGTSKTEETFRKIDGKAAEGNDGERQCHSDYKKGYQDGFRRGYEMAGEERGTYDRIHRVVEDRSGPHRENGAVFRGTASVESGAGFGRASGVAYGRSVTVGDVRDSGDLRRSEYAGRNLHLGGNIRRNGGFESGRKIAVSRGGIGLVGNAHANDMMMAKGETSYGRHLPGNMWLPENDYKSESNTFSGAVTTHGLSAAPGYRGRGYTGRGYIGRRYNTPYMMNERPRIHSDLPQTEQNQRRPVIGEEYGHKSGNDVVLGEAGVRTASGETYGRGISVRGGSAAGYGVGIGTAEDQVFPLSGYGYGRGYASGDDMKVGTAYKATAENGRAYGVGISVEDGTFTGYGMGAVH